MSDICQANFLLIDGLLRPDAIAGLYRCGEPLDIEPLYLGTRWSELQELGPILVSAHGSPGVISETHQDARSRAHTSLLYSSAPKSTVARHLRRFIAPPDVLGGRGLLRFADPVVASHWLDSYQGWHLDAVLGPIEVWHVPERLHSWELAHPCEWRSIFRAAPPREWLDTFAQLREPQLDALARAARWRFRERLHLDLDHRHPGHLARFDKKLLTPWFEARLDEAQAWGLASERSLSIWTEYSLRWGEGFTIEPDGPYQQWLARTPEALPLAPEVRIRLMDNACLNIEPNKEVL